ncbi:MAG: trypsin-like peptidase domain-containing protein [Terriglobales bacterium]
MPIPAGAESGHGTQQRQRGHGCRRLNQDGAPGGTVQVSAHTVVTMFSESGQGTGFVIGGDGLIVTNDHVVVGSDYLAVQSDADHRVGAVLLAQGQDHDVAVLQADLGRCRGPGQRRWGHDGGGDGRRGRLRFCERHAAGPGGGPDQRHQQQSRAAISPGWDEMDQMIISGENKRPPVRKRLDSKLVQRISRQLGRALSRAGAPAGAPGALGRQREGVPRRAAAPLARLCPLSGPGRGWRRAALTQG